MCVIIIKEKGQKLISKENLKKCFIHNPDGAGIAWTIGTPENPRPISIEKGFMKFEDLWDYLTKLGFKYKDPDLVDISMIIHCRITTHGLTNRSNTHPFPLSENEEDLCAVSLRKQSKAIAHNGVVSSVSMFKTDKLSDTMEFIKTQLYPISEMNKDWNKYPKVLKAIEEIIGSKLAILNTDGTIDRVGVFNLHEDMLWYSNMHWEWNQNAFAWRGTDVTSTPYHNKNLWDYCDNLYPNDYFDAADSEFSLSNDDSCCTPSTNSKLYEGVDTLTDIDFEENKSMKLNRLMDLIDRGVTQCKGSEIPKLFTDLDEYLLTDIILTEWNDDNKSYYAYEGERFIYPIVSGGFDKEIDLDDWVKENGDKTFVFDINMKDC